MRCVHLTFDCRRNRSDMFEKTEEATEVSNPNHVGPFFVNCWVVLNVSNLEKI